MGGSLACCGSTICGGRGAGGRHEDVFDRASVDGERGACRVHEARYFASDAPGDVVELGAWSSAAGEPAPSWYTALCEG